MPITKWQPKYLLVTLIALAFLTGGGSRAEISSLMVLRPVAALMLFAGLITLTWQHVTRYRTLSFLALATIALCAIHLIPLPPGLWQALPGRDIVAEIDRLAGLEGSWRPLTMDPIGGFNAFWSLLVPFAVLVLAIQLDDKGMRLALTALISLGLLSALVAILQVISGPQSPLYFYRISSPGLPVGLFANRNHQAVLLACLVPLGAAWLQAFDWKATKGRISRSAMLFVYWGIVAILIVVVLLTGSRAGLASMALAVPAAAWVAGLFDPSPANDGSTRSRMNFRRVGLVFASLFPVAALSVVATGLDRGLAIERLLGSSPADDLRARIVPAALDLTARYAPFGSGLGSFETVFKIHESDDFLGPAYVNHVHNDFVEVAMTLGIPGFVLTFFAGLAMATAARSCFKKDGGSPGSLALRRASLAVLFLLAFASLWDYPLRVPSIQSLGVLAAIWLARGAFDKGYTVSGQMSGYRKTKGFE